MRNSKFFVLSLAVAFATEAYSQDFCNTVTHSGESTVVTSNDINDIGNYSYELWADIGNNSATFYTDGSFSCEFNNVNDYLCREGIRYGMNSGLKYTDLGHLYADFKLTDPSFKSYSNVTYSYIGRTGLANLLQTVTNAACVAQSPLTAPPTKSMSTRSSAVPSKATTRHSRSTLAYARASVLAEPSTLPPTLTVGRA